MKRKLSIIVPVFNNENEIKRCVDSIYASKIIIPEVILVDDGSTDMSGMICDELARQYESLRVIHKENGGTSSARNSGVEVAEGKYIGFVDGDDYIEPNMYQKLLSEIHDFDCVMCGIYKNDIPIKINMDKKIVTGTEVVKEVIGNGTYKGYVVNKLFKKDIILNNNIRFKQDVHMCEDLIFCLEYLSHVRLVCCLSDNLYHYVIRSGSASTGGFSNKKFSMIYAYNYILKMEIIKSEPRYKTIVTNRKIRHCISMWNQMSHMKFSLEDQYYRSILDEICKSPISFLLSKYEPVKYRICYLYVVLKYKKKLSK